MTDLAGTKYVVNLQPTSDHQLIANDRKWRILTNPVCRGIIGDVTTLLMIDTPDIQRLVLVG